MSAAAPIPFASEATATGQQVLAPGVAPVAMKARPAHVLATCAKQSCLALAAHPLASFKMQKPCDISSFDEVARSQMDLFSANPSPKAMET